MRGIFLFLVLWLMVLGCSKEQADPDTPEGSLQRFIGAIEHRDKDLYWSLLDRETQMLFKKHLEILVQMNRDIDKYFGYDPLERRRLRKMAGLSVLDALVNDAVKAFKEGKRKYPNPTHKDLFLYLMNLGSKRGLEAVPFQADQKVGADIDEVVKEDDTHVKITTKSGQIYRLVHEDRDDKWHLMRSSPAFAIQDFVVKKEEIREEHGEEVRILLEVRCQSKQLYYFEKNDKGQWQGIGLSRAMLQSDDEGKEYVLIDVFSRALVPIENSEMAILQYAQENIDQELERRDRVIRAFESNQF